MHLAAVRDGLDGPSRTITVEPLEEPAPAPREVPTPAPEDPVEEREAAPEPVEAR